MILKSGHRVSESIMLQQPCRADCVFSVTLRQILLACRFLHIRADCAA